ncbi:hypothetical protein [Allofrancisella frigidaquae]|uniref:Uncharacterized protein n=1 Tax=Allofrancisella frigidaquae TaxID=1085644 RepID=A0A6M3HSL7_9GAMM|nr:hypothetical protein [Allofrancisella frigidaquae]QIV94117.1 hypothetical protein E3E15_01600 [Allofrancisella frigidaquae]
MRFHPYENNNDITIEYYKNKILTNLPDKDASVLCELVYESMMLENIVNNRAGKEKTISNLIYNLDKKTLNKISTTLLFQI